MEAILGIGDAAKKSLGQCNLRNGQSFLAVLGPNRSGKSNVIDAMLFVFGKRVKQMRLNKVSELIHNSTKRQNLESAAVSVYFQEIIDLDDGNYEVVQGSDFATLVLILSRGFQVLIMRLLQ